MRWSAPELLLAGLLTFGSNFAFAQTRVQITEDNFEPTIRFVGPTQQLSAPFLGVQHTNEGRLRSWLNKKTGAITHQFYVTETHFGPWNFWYAAYGENGRSLRLVSISQEVAGCGSVTGCAVTEIFGTDVDDIDLRTYPHGFSIKIKSKRGLETVISVSGEQIREQLAAVDSKRSQLNIGQSIQQPADRAIVPSRRRVP